MIPPCSLQNIPILHFPYSSSLEPFAGPLENLPLDDQVSEILALQETAEEPPAKRPCKERSIEPDSVSLSDYSSFLTVTKEQVEKVLEKIDQLKRLPPPLKISVERAKEGDAESCNDLGRWCFIHPVEIHPKYSCTLFASAIMGGYVPAKCNLGYYYQYSGRSLPSLIMAKQLYFDSVTAFPPYAPGINVLGLLYLKDQGREKLSFKEKQNLLAQAARLFTMGAMQLHEPACMHNLAYCYANGYGVARSIEKATQLHSDAIMLPPNEELKHLIPGVLSYYSREDVVYFP